MFYNAFIHASYISNFLMNYLLFCLKKTFRARSFAFPHNENFSMMSNNQALMKIFMISVWKYTVHVGTVYLPMKMLEN